ncbi:protein containing DUF940, bacterial membrane lipoprotein putative [gut metagenome]|uniref:Protein containing DUF940, bacterial membrane lipoprotein putative n=1 Tax=gut metagenome TaxID=749906 RepID=J9C729_9ZZZZ
MRSTKIVNGVEQPDNRGLHRKDRFFSAKVQPLREREGRWWPSLAVGMNDFSGREVGEPIPDRETGRVMDCGNDIFANWYVAASKHVALGGHRLGVHVAYRDWGRVANSNCDGLVGGLTFQPAFDPNLRFIAEYTGDDVNVGFDWKLWKHLLLQSSLQNGKYFSGGLCFCINLL